MTCQFIICKFFGKVLCKCFVAGFIIGENNIVEPKSINNFGAFKMPIYCYLIVWKSVNFMGSNTKKKE